MHALNVINLSRRTIFAAVVVATMAGCASTTKSSDIANTLGSKPELSTLNGLIKQAGLSDTLKGTGPFTVFAPTNEAFKAVPAKTMSELGSNPEQLKAVLTYHVVPSKLVAADVKNSKIKSVQGASLEISTAGEMVTVENAMVTQADVMATNGVIHVVDAVMLPPAPKK
jgi:uncharacterized surface protein with fasciclin (FAS1) repeats